MPGAPGSGEPAPKAEDLAPEASEDFALLDHREQLDADAGERHQLDGPAIAQAEQHVISGRHAEVSADLGGKPELRALAVDGHAPDQLARERERGRRGEGEAVSRSMPRVHAGEGTAPGAPGGVKNFLDNGGRPGRASRMPRRPLVIPQDSMTAAERSEHARIAGVMRWRRRYKNHYADLRQIGTAALKAYAQLQAEIRAMHSTRTVELEHGLHRLVAAFANLWNFSGHDLPPGIHAEAAGFVDELRRQAAEDDTRPAPAGKEGTHAE